ncbi:MAG: hypothetical protein RIA65_18335 [Woeseia sp.]
MDKLDQQLAQDAAAIDAELTDTWRQRLDARWREARPVTAEVSSGWQRPALRFAGLAAGLVGLLVASGLFQRTRPIEDVRLATVPPYTQEAVRPLPLEVEQVDLTQPLQQELLNLQADVEKARQSIERDLRRSF